MTPTDELRTRLRKLLDERIPPGGSAADTRFSDEDLDELLVDAKTIYGAAAAGWAMKAGMYQREMADVEQSDTGEEHYKLTGLKDRMQYALTMASTYQGMDKSSSSIGSRILRITEPEVL